MKWVWTDFCIIALRGAKVPPLGVIKGGGLAGKPEIQSVAAIIVVLITIR